MVVQLLENIRQFLLPRGEFSLISMHRDTMNDVG